MTTEAMPQADTGVHRRSDSTSWQWQIKAPKDLRHAYPSQWAHRCSLGTSDIREANRKAAQLRAHWLARFDEQRRQLNPQKVEGITPAMAKFIAEKLLHDCLSVDDRVRTEPRFRVAFRSQYKRASLAGMPEVLIEELHNTNQEELQRWKAALAARRLKEALPALQRTAQELGLVIDQDTPGVEVALLECLKALKEAATLGVQRDQGEFVETPPAPALKTTEEAKPRFLRDVFDRWKAAKERGKDSLASTERALKLFEKHTGNPPLAKITRDQGDAFRAWLLTQSGASKTKRDKLTAVKSLLNYARRDLEWLSRNPWEGLEIEYRTENKRPCWTGDQVRAFFTLPLFTKYELPNLWNSGEDAAYWIPLLGLHTGARIGELCQLRIADVLTREGQVFISINDEAEGSKVKTAASVRDVPLHSELVRLGFLEYVEATKKAGSESLWPALKFRDGKPGGYFSAWFGKARKLVPEGVPDFHALRHTVRTMMSEAGFPEMVLDRIT